MGSHNPRQNYVQAGSGAHQPHIPSYFETEDDQSPQAHVEVKVYEATPPRHHISLCCV
jgi:hypothetical protein